MVGSGWVARRQFTSFGQNQPVGYSDLRADDVNFAIIRSIYGEGDRQLLGQSVPQS
jgi:hypothetical protein